MSVRAVVFDWDNTLIDTWPVLSEAINATLRHMGHTPWTLEEVRIKTARSMKDYFPELFGERWEEAGRYFHTVFRELHLKMLTPLPGAQDMLEALKKNGIYLAVVSNKIPKILQAEADALGWSSYFGRVVGSGEALRDKPAPDPLYLALQDSGISSGPDVWFVGDATVDIQCGQNAGCKTALVALNGSEKNALALNPDFSFSHYNALLAHLLETKGFP